ncbi:hypothetical protein G9A89_011342 [Geosiphon pyriformis]|nr:hypothetical protein G9A89_011342 [Geosiphon pyriformis]
MTFTRQNNLKISYNEGFLTYREKARKVKKEKIIKKSKIKKNYYTKIKKQSVNTPEFYKEIFTQGVSQVQDLNGETTANERKPEKGKSKGDASNPNKKNHIDEDLKEDLDTEAEKNLKNKMLDEKRLSEAKQIKSRKSLKPNPFNKIFEATEQLRQEAQNQKEAKIKESEARKEKRLAYYVKRKQTKKKLFKRTSKGQPVMKNHIEHLLCKIKNT